MTADAESLESFVGRVCGEENLRIEDDLGDGFVRLRSSEAERRQAAQDIRSTEDVVIELLRNARDAGAHNVFLAATREGTARRLVAIDDGEGVPAHLHERIFEPRVTSKLDSMRQDKWGIHGRGMALYSIAQNAKSARIVASEPGKGTSVSVETDLARLGEKTDQSTFPSFELCPEGAVTVRGPKNIVRMACEFAIEARDACAVYLGSAADVAATLYAFGRAALPASVRAFCVDSSTLAVAHRLSVAPDAEALAQEAAAVGLGISQRTARRIMDGQVAPLVPLLKQIEQALAPAPTTQGGAPRPRKAAAAQTTRAPKFHADDLDQFAERVAGAFAPLARDYYLQADVEARVRVSGGSIHVEIPLSRDE